MSLTDRIVPCIDLKMTVLERILIMSIENTESYPQAAGYSESFKMTVFRGNFRSDQPELCTEKYGIVVR